jgi:hypothetical protein
LRRDKWIDEVLALLQHGLNLTASTSTHRLPVECLPQIIDTASSGSGSSIDQHADIGLQNLSKRLEEPSVRIDLLLILLLEAEQDLDRCAALLDTDNPLLDLECHLGGVLVDMCCHVFAVDLLLCNAVLVDAHRCEE